MFLVNRLPESVLIITQMIVKCQTIFFKISAKKYLISNIVSYLYQRLNYIYRIDMIPSYRYDGTVLKFG